MWNATIVLQYLIEWSEFRIFPAVKGMPYDRHFDISFSYPSPVPAMGPTGLVHLWLRFNGEGGFGGGETTSILSYAFSLRLSIRIFKNFRVN